jgi:hypothetical protein
VIAVIGVVYSAGYFPGLVAGSPPPPGNVNITFNPNDIIMMMELVYGKSLDHEQATEYIQSLNIQAYLVGNQTYEQIITWYNNTYTQDGWILLTQNISHGLGYDMKACSWLKGTNMRVVVSASGNTVLLLYRYQTLVITGDGLATDFSNFIIWLNES